MTTKQALDQLKKETEKVIEKYADIPQKAEKRLSALIKVVKGGEN